MFQLLYDIGAATVF